MNHIKNATILVIDDEVENLIIIEEMLNKSCQQIILQSNPELGLALAIKKQPDIILLDILMREMDGYETCRRLKVNPETDFIPVIFLSSLTRASDKVKGFEAGAVDYVSKPFNTEEMVARIESCLKVHHQIQKTHHNKVNLENLKAYLLKERELEVLQLYIAGHSRKSIAKQTGITANTIKWYLSNIFKKVEVSNRAELLEKLALD